MFSFLLPRLPLHKGPFSFTDGLLQVSYVYRQHLRPSTLLCIAGMCRWSRQLPAGGTDRDLARRAREQSFSLRSTQSHSPQVLSILCSHTPTLPIVLVPSPSRTKDKALTPSSPRQLHSFHTAAPQRPTCPAHTHYPGTTTHLNHALLHCPCRIRNLRSLARCCR